MKALVGIRGWGEEEAQLFLPSPSSLKLQLPPEGAAMALTAT